MPATAPRTTPDSPPSSGGGWSESVQTLKNAIMVPPVDSATVQDCGVITAEGSFCPESATWRGSRPMMTPPEGPVVAARKLEGRHLYGGQLWAHFGHFMAESLSRLWALDHLKRKPESIVFLPKRPGRSGRLKAYQREFFKLLGIDIPVRVLDQPTEVERLIVPGQGFGLGEIAAGTESFRSFFSRNFATDIAADGPADIYLSRSLLGGLEGSVVLEPLLEHNLEGEGYTIFHPQRHSLAEQVARYRAARRIIGLDGSAFHLFAFAGHRDQKVAVVLRRSSNVFLGLQRHITGFTGIEPYLVDELRADWIPEHKSRPGRYSFGQLDFEALRVRLAQGGFLPEKGTWEIPRFRDVKQAMAQFSQDKGTEYIRHKRETAGTDKGTGSATARKAAQ